MDISRDQDSFSQISRQESILTLCHGGDSESAFKNTSVQVGFNCRGGGGGGLLEKPRRSTVSVE